MTQPRLQSPTGLACLAALGLALAAPVQAQRANTGGGRNQGAARNFGAQSGAFGGGGGATSSGTRQYYGNGEVGEAVITSDPETRRLIVITDDETSGYISQVITNLDRPKPQVLIKVVFLQVTRGNDLDLGVEGTYRHKIKSDTDGTASTSFGLENAAALAAGGGVYKILNDNLEVTIRALAVAGKTEILSRPSILARNNQQATIVVGQEVPFITNTRFDAVNGQINTVEYQDIGIILRVTPFITSDGMVEMIVSPEISSLSDRTVDIGGGIDVPVIDKRSADTVVVTPDGKTIAIGGLIGTQKVDQDRKVPLLGDIPLLGWAFKRKVKTETKTELMIFLTPYVVQKPGDLARMTQDEGTKLEMAPKTFSEKDLNRYLDGLPMKQPAPATVPDAKKRK